MISCQLAIEFGDGRGKNSEGKWLRNFFKKIFINYMKKSFCAF